MRTLRFTIAYDGTNYAGWQFQLNGPSIQALVEQALAKITGEKITVFASGRTDAGVHALGQVVSFRTTSGIAPAELVRALNGNLPFDLCVLDAAEAPDGFHATWSARRKRYRYWIQDGPLRDVLSLRYAWWIPKRLDADAMHRAAQALVGTHDFTSFEARGSEAASPIRTIEEFSVRRETVWMGERIVLEVQADGFLQHMVRIMVGTLAAVGRGSEDENWPARVLANRDRKHPGMTAPPQGLYLVRVEYDDSPAKAEARLPPADASDAGEIE